MDKPKTYFEQVPLEVVKKIVDQQIEQGEPPTKKLKKQERVARRPTRTEVTT
jgi:hypothetical protein